jgi:hypothetical protein
MKKYFVILFFLSLVPIAFCQESNTNSESKKETESSEEQKANDTRHVFVYGGVGLLEVFTYGVGFQLNNKFSLSMGYSYVIVGGDAFILPDIGQGYVIKAGYFSNFWIFNSLNIEYLNILKTYTDKGVTSKSKGYFAEINFAHETISKCRLGFYWSLGVCLSNAKMKPQLCTPSIKIGCNYNIF